MIMLEGQPRVPQESDGQRWSAADAAEAGSKRPAQREDVDGAEVGKFAGLEVAPDLLDGIQFRRIARQSFDRQPRPLVSEILAHHAALGASGVGATSPAVEGCTRRVPGGTARA